MKKDYAISDTWVSYELHPETPLDGVLLSARFRGMDIARFHADLRARGREFGLVFGDRMLLSNSRRALLAAEYARDAGRYETFHENMFAAYFTEGLDIGNPDVVDSVAVKSSLNAEEMRSAVRSGGYLSRLEESRKEGEQLRLTGIPLFIINNKYRIVGAQPLEFFRDLLDKIK